jgi:hypothetical protein
MNSFISDNSVSNHDFYYSSAEPSPRSAPRDDSLLEFVSLEESLQPLLGEKTHRVSSQAAPSTGFTQRMRSYFSRPPPHIPESRFYFDHREVSLLRVHQRSLSHVAAQVPQMMAPEVKNSAGKAAIAVNKKFEAKDVAATKQSTILALLKTLGLGAVHIILVLPQYLQRKIGSIMRECLWNKASTKLDVSSSLGVIMADLKGPSSTWRLEQWTSSSGVSQPKQDALHEIYCLAKAYKKCLGSLDNKKGELSYFPEIIKELKVLQHQVETGRASYDVERKINDMQELFKKCLIKAGADVANFKTEFHKARANSIPTVLESKLHVEDKVFTEKSQKIDASFSKLYLEAVQKEGEFASQIDYLKNNGHRTCALRDLSEAQAMTMNGHRHSAHNERGQEVGSVFRSGAFTVQGRKTSMGLYGLNKKLAQLEQMPEKDLRKELKKLQFESIEQLRKEITWRRQCCISQALPEILAGVKEILKDPEALQIALATGSFLHHVEGLLTHLKGNERVMIEDMKDTLDYLSQNCVFSCGNKDGVALDGNKIHITIESPGVAQQEFKLTATYSNTAVDAAYSTGVDKKESLQDEVNAQALNTLFEYARQAEGAERLPQKQKLEIKEARQALEHHYSAKREIKDLEGIRLKNSLVTALRGAKSIKCKNGQERTSGQVCEILSHSIAKNAQAHQKIHRDSYKQLIGGVSYFLTKQNTAQAGYDFNPAQYLFLPKQYDIPCHLRGSGPA